MADQVTPTSDKTPEELEREMLQTRESLTAKAAELERQVVGTVQNAAETINGTVEAVKSLVTTAPEAVSETVKQATAAVSETVKDTFDVTGHVRRHPWTAVGVSAFLGGLVGYLTARGRPDFAGLAASSPPAPAPAAPSYAAAVSSSEPPGIIDEFMGMLGDKAKEMARSALETVSAAIKQNIETGVPKLVDDAASRLTDAAGGAGFAGRFDARRSGV